MRRRRLLLTAFGLVKAKGCLDKLAVRLAYEMAEKSAEQSGLLGWLDRLGTDRDDRLVHERFTDDTNRSFLWSVEATDWHWNVPEWLNSAAGSLALSSQWIPAWIPAWMPGYAHGGWRLEPRMVQDLLASPPVRTPELVGLARAAYDDVRDDYTMNPDLLGILADALEDQDCSGWSAACRLPIPYYRGTWVVDWLLGYPL